jgi:hypothetical protein
MTSALRLPLHEKRNFTLYFLCSPHGWLATVKADSLLVLQPFPPRCK